MQTNGCTYGAALDCGKHGARESVQPHERRGSVVRVVKFDGGKPWRKHGGYVDEGRKNERAALDAIAHRKVVPMGAHGLVIRKAVR